MPLGVHLRPIALRQVLRQRFHQLVLACCIVVLIFEFAVVPLLGFSHVRLDPDPSHPIPPAQGAQLDLYKDRIQNLILLALAIAGAGTAAAYNRYAHRALPPRNLHILLSCWSLIGLSICSGLWGRFNLDRLLARGLVGPESLSLTYYPGLIQIAALIASAPFLGSFLIRALRTVPSGD